MIQGAPAITSTLRPEPAGAPPTRNEANEASFPSGKPRRGGRLPRRAPSNLRRQIARGEYYEDLPIVIAVTADRLLTDLEVFA